MNKLFELRQALRMPRGCAFRSFVVLLYPEASVPLSEALYSAAFTAQESVLSGHCDVACINKIDQRNDESCSGRKAMLHEAPYYHSFCYCSIMFSSVLRDVTGK